MTYRQRFAQVSIRYMDYAKEAFEAEDYPRATSCLDTAFEFAHIAELGLPGIDREVLEEVSDQA